MILLNPYKSKELQLSNRIIMAPMTRSRADNLEHAATELVSEYYAQRASAGLIISEGTFVNARAIGYINVPHIYTSQQIESWKEVTNAVHKKGGKIFAQLWHVGRISHPDLLGGKLPLAPSAINPNFTAYTQSGLTATVTPQEMTLVDIADTIRDFQKAAVNAIEAGFDGVEIHAANGYLFHQFFAKCSNTRTDNYGGSIEKRIQFLFETLDAILEKVDVSKVSVRIAPTLEGTFGITKDDETDALFDEITKRLNTYPLAYLHISGFTTASTENPLKTVLETAKRLREIYKGTLMINKGFDRNTANTAIEDGIADLISFGELFIGNPDLVERFRLNAPLNKNDLSTYYTPGPKGYIDYPFYKNKE